MEPDEARSSVFLADSDASIHHFLSLQAHQFGKHSVLDALAHGRFPPAVVAWAWRRRKSVIDNFLILLERTRLTALQEGKAELAAAIHANLADEYGLDPESGRPTGEGSHREWARWLMEALDVLDPPGGSDQNTSAHLPQWNLLPYRDDDHLAVLAGMCMAVEKSIPIEYHAFLKALEAAFPALDSSDHPRALHLLKDHVVHDEQRHLPDLVDGYLGAAPGSLHVKIHAEPDLEGHSLDIARGVERVFAMRLRFYDELASELMSE